MPLSALDDEGTIDDFDALFPVRRALGRPARRLGGQEGRAQQRRFFDVM
ncbi:MAG: hypothetical protein IPG84_12135, partial [Betaproteobacteria bacterium]|nr:hypothetical protein [Betaproteobacteria bacterium]